MEPLSIILTTVGWIVKLLVRKLVGEAWEMYTKHVGLFKEVGSLKDELTKIQLLVEAAQSKQLPNEKVHLHRSLKDMKALIYKAQNLLDELDYFRLQKEEESMKPSKQGLAKHGIILCGLKSMSLRQLPSSSKAGDCQKLEASMECKINY